MLKKGWDAGESVFPGECGMRDGTSIGIRKAGGPGGSSFKF